MLRMNLYKNVFTPCNCLNFRKASSHCVAAFAHLNDMSVSELCVELRLRGQNSLATEAADVLRDRLRADIPGNIPGVWPREIRLISQDLNLDGELMRTANLPSQIFAQVFDNEKNFAEIFRTDTPKLLLSLTNEWPAISKWSSAQKFINLFENENVRLRGVYEVAVHGGQDKRTSPTLITVSELLSQFRNSSVLSFSTCRDEMYSTIRNDIPLEGSSPNDIVAHALRSLSMRPVLSIGGALSGLCFHRHEGSWLSLLHGRKLWCFLPPSTPPARPLERNSLSNLIQTNSQNMLLCIQRKGEIVYVPRGWWHATYNISSGGVEDDGTGQGQVGRGSGGGGGGGIDLEDRVAIGFGGIGESPGLHWDIAEGKVGHLDQALATHQKLDVDALKQVTSSGQTLMHTACMHGHLDVARWLINQETDDMAKRSLVTALDSLGRTPLHLACVDGSAELISWLLNLGANPRSRSSLGDSAIGLAKRNNRTPDILSLLSSSHSLGYD